MKKRILSIVLVLVIIAMTGCGTKGRDSESKREFHSSASSERTDGFKSKPADKGDRTKDDAAKESSYDTDFSSTDSVGTADVFSSASSAVDDKSSKADMVATEGAPGRDVYDSSTEGESMSDGTGASTTDGGLLISTTEAPLSKSGDDYDGDMIDLEIMPEEKIPEDFMRNATAGLLTAGEWNDNDNWGFFSNVISTGQLSFPSFGLEPLYRVAVTVINEAGNPVKNASVTLKSSNGEIIWEAVTNYKGMAYLFYNSFNKTTELPSTVDVSKGEAFITEAVNLEVVNNQQGQGQVGLSAVTHDMVVTLQDGTDKKALDIMFVFDTTGSMSDELYYLQKEFEDIAKRTADQNTRFCINFYRDEGDTYVVKSNEFTSDTAELVRQLNNENADGGGDYPEAVDQALNNGIFQHSWNSESVKLLFLILDAPPHNGEPQIDDSLKRSIMEAARQGIRIIPIASSGVDIETETFLRTSAIMTGGTYTFLTNDSGIGNSHLEPTIGSYKVEPLNDCIVRIIKTYYQ